MNGERHELGDLLEACAGRWRSRVVEACAAAGFPEATATTCAVLAPLFERDGLPISEVARSAGLAKSSMTTIVRGLERQGLVRVEEDGADHRVKRLRLTARARALEGAIQGGVTRLRHRVTAALGPAGQRELHRTLKRIHDTL